MNGVGRGYHSSVTLSHFITCLVSSLRAVTRSLCSSSPASLELTNSIVLPPNSSPLPREPSAPLIMQCRLDNVKCVGLSETCLCLLTNVIQKPGTFCLTDDQWFFKLKHRISKDDIWQSLNLVNKVQNGELIINHLKGWFLLCLLYGKCQYPHTSAITSL